MLKIQAWYLILHSVSKIHTRGVYFDLIQLRIKESWHIFIFRTSNRVFESRYGGLLHLLSPISIRNDTCCQSWLRLYHSCGEFREVLFDIPIHIYLWYHSVLDAQSFYDFISRMLSSPEKTFKTIKPIFQVGYEWKNLCKLTQNVWCVVWLWMWMRKT